MSEMKEHSRIWLDDSTIRYQSSNEPESWALPAEQVKVVGEFTNDHGPYVDDWFLIFVTGLEPFWQEASCYADGMDKFKTGFSTRFGSKLELNLYASANFSSRILWPDELSGKPLFNLVDEKPIGIKCRLRRLVGVRIIYSYLTDDVQRFVGLPPHGLVN